MKTPERPKIGLAGSLADELRREAAALNLDPQGLLASIVRPFVVALRQGRYETAAAERELGRRTGEPPEDP